MTRWKNKKTGYFYALLAYGTDQTHNRGTAVIVYSPEWNPHEICVMDHQLFFEEFEESVLSVI